MKSLSWSIESSFRVVMPSPTYHAGHKRSRSAFTMPVPSPKAYLRKRALSDSYEEPVISVCQEEGNGKDGEMV